MRRFVLSIAAILLLAAPAHAGPGDPDRSFGQRGSAAFTLFGTGGNVRGLAFADGRRPLLSVVVRDPATTLLTPAALRLDAGGRLASQTPFPAQENPVLFADGHALTPLAVVPGSPRAFSLASVGSSRPGVTLTIPHSHVVLAGFGVDRAGRAVVSGYSASPDGPLVYVIRFLPTGEIDTSYAQGGSVNLGNVDSTALLVTRDGRAFVGHGDGTITALDARGRALRGFLTDALSRERPFTAVRALLPGPGMTLLAAVFDGVARLRADGRLDRRFGDDGLVYGSPLKGVRANAMTTDRRRRPIIADTEGHTIRVARLTARGRIDTTFGRRGIATVRPVGPPGVALASSVARAIAVDERGRIVVAGDGWTDERGLGAQYPVIARLEH